MDCLISPLDTMLAISEMREIFKYKDSYKTAAKIRSSSRFPLPKSFIIIRGPKYPLVFTYYTHGISPTIMEVTPNTEYFIFLHNISDEPGLVFYDTKYIDVDR